MRQCPHCAREIATLAHDEKMNCGGRLSVAIEVLETAQVAPHVQVIGVCGAPAAAHLTPRVYRIGEAEIIVIQRPSRTHPRRWDLLGAVHLNGRAPKMLSGASVELYRGEDLLSVTPVSLRGQFALTALEPGRYHLNLVWGHRKPPAQSATTA